MLQCIYAAYTALVCVPVQVLICYGSSKVTKKNPHLYSLIGLPGDRRLILTLNLKKCVLRTGLNLISSKEVV